MSSFSPPHQPPVLRLLSLSVTELVPPPPLLPPVVSSTTLSPTQLDAVSKDGFIVKENLEDCNKPNRQLYCNELCCCVRLSHDGVFTGWERCNETLPLAHFVHPLSYAKSELIRSKPSLTKLTGASKTELSGRLYRGYYEKSEIPFHFQHLESSSAHAELYRRDHTYPTLEEWSTKDQCTSVSLSSVLEPKQLTLGVSKPEGTEQSKALYSRMPQSHKFHASDKRPHPYTHYRSLDNLTTKSATTLEVYHGQTSSLSLGNLPAPSDSPPSPRRALDPFTSTHSAHFKDIINIDNSPLPGRHHSRPHVRWASHQLPPSLLSTHKRRADSPQPMKMLGGNAVKRKTWESSQPQTKGTSGHSTNASKHFNAMLTKNMPTKQRKEPIQRHSEVPLSHVTGHVTRGRRKKKETPSVSLMPTSKALVPSIGVYTRTALAQSSLEHF